MLELSRTITSSSIWRATLAATENDQYQNERERLRASFVNFRDRASLLATEIGKDLPDLTIHDITHLDALWEVASQITGDDFFLTPTESYVLGGAILLHDLAMSIAATPGGYAALTADQRWRDLVFASYNQLREEPPSPMQLEEPDEDVKRHAIFSLLRLVHAENAEKLAFLSFGNDPTAQQFLIEDTELRQTFGRLIGQIAHSHWWSIGEIDKTFDRTVGAPHWAPPSWTVNPLKVACILRAADAAHIDARRAPTFSKSFANIGASSRVHWVFQERLNKAYLNEDALVFTSGLAFPVTEASAWWLCLETLRMIDRELRGIDSLLSDRTMPRFAAKRVAGVDLPERLATYVQTADWLPINATVHISDLPHIIRSLGGEELYGKHPRVPLRELLQNASDAIRARRYYEARPPEFGEITIALYEENGAHYLQVSDNGAGMSQRVLTDFLLDFGSSFWSKPQVQEEFPGLISSGFMATGRYGIGFFSVFMAADHVTVFTRRPDAAAKETLVLEFGAGLSGRPILRPALRKEQLRDGGTTVQLQLKAAPYSKGGLLHTHEDQSPSTLLDVCRKLAPSLDTRVLIFADQTFTIAIEPNDWTRIPGEQLLERINHETFREMQSPAEIAIFCVKAAENLRLIVDDAGKPVARACITSGFRSYEQKEPTLSGVLTVGGFSASPLHGIAGIIVGESTRAARDSAKSIVSDESLAKWANEQASLALNLYTEPITLADVAQNIRLCGGNASDLPIALHNGSWVSFNQIASMSLPNEIIIIDHFIMRTELKHAEGFLPDDNVFITNASGLTVIFQPDFGSVRHGHGAWRNKAGTPLTLAGAVIEAAAISWGIEVEEMVAKHDFEKEDEVRVGMAASGKIECRAIVILRSEKQVEH